MIGRVESPASTYHGTTHEVFPLNLGYRTLCGAVEGLPEVFLMELTDVGCAACRLLSGRPAVETRRETVEEFLDPRARHAGQRTLFEVEPI